MKLLEKMLSMFLAVHFVISNSLVGYCSDPKSNVNTDSDNQTIPKVSVIVPVYNTEDYLRKCLDSIKNQTLRDIEIICIDDGSTDKSGEILDGYAKEDGDCP